MDHRHHNINHHHQGNNHGGGDSPYDDPFLKCCCCCHPLLAVSYIFGGFQRCILLACYPFFKCFGWNDPSSGYHHIEWFLFLLHPYFLISSVLPPPSTKEKVLTSNILWLWLWLWLMELLLGKTYLWTVHFKGMKCFVSTFMNFHCMQQNKLAKRSISGIIEIC